MVYAIWSDDRYRSLVVSGDDYDRVSPLLGKAARNDWGSPPKLTIEQNKNFASNEQDIPDIELAASGEPILSPKAHGVLQNILDPWIELLPVMIPGGEKWFLCNFTQTLDVLDHERSEILRWPTLGNIRGIPKYVFHEDRLQGVSLFRIPERPVVVFATECFADKVRTAGLTGLDFRNPDEKWHGTAGPKGRLPG